MVCRLENPESLLGKVPLSVHEVMLFAVYLFGVPQVRSAVGLILDLDPTDECVHGNLADAGRNALSWLLQQLLCGAVLSCHEKWLVVDRLYVQWPL